MQLKIRLVLLLSLLCLIGSPILAADSFVRFAEVTSDGSVIPLPGEQSYFNVDLNSYVNVDFAPQLLLQKNHSLDSPESKKLRSQLANLNQLLLEAEQQLDSYLQEIQRVQPLLTTSDDPTLRSRYLQALQGHGQLILNILNLLEPVVGEEALNQALLSPDPTYRELLGLVQGQIEIVREQLREEVDRVLAESQLSLRVWCIQQAPNKNPVAIHLQNYDDLQRGTFHMVDKVTLVMTEEERQQLLANADLYQSLQQSLQNIDQQGYQIQLIFEELKSHLILELTEVKNQLQRQVELSQTVTLIKGTQRELELVVDAEVEPLKQSLAQLMDVVSPLAEVEEQFSTQLNELTRAFEGVNPLLQMELAFSQLNQLSQTAMELQQHLQQSYLQQITDLVTKIQQQAQTVPRSLAKKVQQRLKSLQISLDQDWIAQREATRKLIAQLDLTRYLGSLQSLVTNLSFVENIAGESNLDAEPLIPAEIRQVRLADAPTTTIEIPWTQRTENDRYHLTVQVFSQKGIVYDQEFIFRVKKFGLASTWMTNLAFMQESSARSYQPVTAVSWILHYQGRSQGDLSWHQQVWNLLEPGVGVSSIVYSEEDHFQNGLGISVTLFDDLFQVGYGMKFLDSSEERRDFFFIGTSLFHFLNPSSQAEF